MKVQTKGSIMLLCATLIWGTSLVAQSVGMKYIGPFLFNSIRFLIGSVFLIPLIILSSFFNKQNSSCTNLKAFKDKKLLKSGLICGFILFLTAALQQSGIAYTTVSKAGFITALYIVIVPVLGMFTGKHISYKTWLCILVSLIGIYLLSMKGRFYLSIGDSLMLLCAFTTAIHIIVVDHFSSHIDGIKLSCLQFLVCGLLSFLFSIIFERTNVNSVISAIIPIMYSGILSCGIAYTLQTLGQKYVSPSATALIFSLESVFSVLSGYFFLNEILSLREICGCILIFSAILTAQLTQKS